jgi:hypothetical protein
MNAILREGYEAPVLTNQAIEVHLSYLRPAVDSIQAEIPVLRKEIRALDEKLSGQIDALDTRLSGKIDKLTERVLEMQGNRKGLILFITICTLLVSGVSVARTLDWI